MKCSSRRNCNRCGWVSKRADFGLNEVQLPKELQLAGGQWHRFQRDASMKCSSRRNCNNDGVDDIWVSPMPQ